MASFCTAKAATGAASSGSPSSVARSTAATSRSAVATPIDPTSAAFLLAESRQQPMHVAGLQLYERPADAGEAERASTPWTSCCGMRATGTRTTVVMTSSSAVRPHPLACAGRRVSLIARA